MQYLNINSAKNQPEWWLKMPLANTASSDVKKGCDIKKGIMNHSLMKCSN
jgi:hypothetical protein